MSDPAWMDVRVVSRHSTHPNFYKFMPADTALKVLANGTLRWSTPGTFNDPFDTQFDPFLPAISNDMRAEIITRYWDAVHNWGPADPKSPLGSLIQRTRGAIPKQTRAEVEASWGPALDEMLSEENNKVIDQLYEAMHEHFRSVKILCLTTKISSVQMWSHYAKDHTGVSLQFRSDAYLDSPWIKARPVAYLATMPHLLDPNVFMDFLAGRAHIDPRKLSDLIIYSKSLEWQNENEWRISSGNGRASEARYEDIPFHPLELAAVILGCRMGEEDSDRIIKIVREGYPFASIHRAAKSKREYTIVVGSEEA